MRKRRSGGAVVIGVLGDVDIEIIVVEKERDVLLWGRENASAGRRLGWER